MGLVRESGIAMKVSTTLVGCAAQVVTQTVVTTKGLGDREPALPCTPRHG
jgi:hypothetical protein